MCVCVRLSVDLIWSHCKTRNASTLSVAMAIRQIKIIIFSLKLSYYPTSVRYWCTVQVWHLSHYTLQSLALHRKEWEDEGERESDSKYLRKWMHTKSPNWNFNFTNSIADKVVGAAAAASAEWNPFELSTEANQKKDKITQRSEKYRKIIIIRRRKYSRISPDHDSNKFI